MQDLIFEKSPTSVRDSLHLLRATYWAKHLTSDQFKERNRRLYQHPFGQLISTYRLLDSKGNLCASLDALEVSFLTGSFASVRKEGGSFLAFVVVPPEKHGQGFGGELLQRFCAMEKRATMLFSDVGEKFYRTFGFKARPQRTRFTPVNPSQTAVNGEPISQNDFLKILLPAREQKLKASSQAFHTLAPDALFLDWRYELYRVFAWVSKAPFPEQVCWEMRHQGVSHAVALAPDFKLQRLDVLYTTHPCDACFAFILSQARRWGLPQVRDWEDGLGSTDEVVEWAMVRSPDNGLLETQIGDWW